MAATNDLANAGCQDVHRGQVWRDRRYSACEDDSVTNAHRSSHLLKNSAIPAFADEHEAAAELGGAEERQVGECVEDDDRDA